MGIFLPLSVPDDDYRHETVDDADGNDPIVVKQDKRRRENTTGDWNGQKGRKRGDKTQQRESEHQQTEAKNKRGA